MVKIRPEYRGRGFSEALYREAAAQLQKDGVGNLRGTVVAPQPLAVRDKVFGDTKVTALMKGETKASHFKVHKDFAASILDAANKKLDAGEDDGVFPHVRASNRIDPSMRFMPGDISKVEIKPPKGGKQLVTLTVHAAQQDKSAQN